MSALSDPSLRVALYCRVSSQEQAQAQTIETQVEFGLRWFDLYGLSPVRIYREEGVSGTVPLEARPQGAQLFADLAAGVINALYVYRVDRLARDIRLMLSAVHRLEGYGARLVSLTESFDTSSPSGRAMLGMLGVFAQYERDSIAERSVAGRLRIAREGRWVGGWRPPYGYTSESGYLEPNDAAIPGTLLTEAAVVRLIYRLLLEDGLSCAAISEHLNALGVPTALAGHDKVNGRSKRLPSGLWSPARIRNMLINPVYGGTQAWGKRSKSGEQPIERPCVALVARETWEQAQQQLRQNRKYSLRNARTEYLLRGLLRCGLCGRTLTGWSPREGHAYYVCAAKVRNLGGGVPRCPSAYVPRRAEEEVWARVREFVFNPEYRTHALAQIAQPPERSEAEELERIDGTLRERQEQRERVLALYRRGRIDEQNLDGQLDQIEVEERELKARRATLLARLPTRPTVAEPEEAYWLRLQADWNAALTTPERQELLRKVVEYILVETKVEGGKRLPVLRVFYRPS